MKEKFLPIGTICTLKNKNKKIIIVGYFSIKYNGDAVIYDYSGLDYPAGLLSNSFYHFNHSDINSIDYLGYESEEFETFNKKIKGQLNNDEEKEYKTNSFFKNIKFDENGVVVFEEMEDNKDTVDEYKKSHFNKMDNQRNEEVKTNVFSNDKFEPSHQIEDANDSENWSIFKSIKFDENGFVIEAEEFSLD